MFWIEGQPSADLALLPQAQQFTDQEIGQALRFCEQLRKAGKRHVTISSELSTSVGKPGVSDELPVGYDWKKRRQ